MISSRPKKGNPNLVEVFERVPSDDNAFFPTTSSHTRSHRRHQQGGGGGKRSTRMHTDEQDYDAILNDADDGGNDDNNIGVRVFPDFASPGGGDGGGFGDGIDDDGFASEFYQQPPPSKKRQQEEQQQQPNEDNERLKPLLTHLEARAKIISNPMIAFVSDIAVKTGTGLDKMLVNPSLPLVNTRSSSLQEVLEGSRFPQDILVALLARSILEQPQLLPVKKEQPKQEAEARGGDEPFASPRPLVSPIVAKKPEPGGNSGRRGTFDLDRGGISLDEARIGASLDGAINLLTRTRHQHIGPPNIFRLPGAAAAAAAGGAAAADPLTDNIIDMMKRFAAASNVIQMAWNEMPEQSGLQLIKPEVVAVIQTAYEEIRGISAAHSQFKLWHLITGSRIRHDFAQMIAGLLNAMPSEIQYPHYQKSVRDNGAVTGSRVSSGVMSQARQSTLYRKKLLFFRHVGYRESTVWREVMDRVPMAMNNLKIARGLVVRAETLLVQRVDTFWKELDEATRDMTGDLYAKELSYDESPVVMAVDLSNQIRLIRRRLQTHLPRTQSGQMPSMGRVVGADASPLVPFAPNYETGDVASKNYPQDDGSGEGAFSYQRPAIPRIIGNNSDPERDDADLIDKSGAALDALETISRRIDSWTMATRYQQIIYDLTQAFIGFRSTLQNVKAVTMQAHRDRKLMATFTEDSKRELVYGRIKDLDTAPVKDYLNPTSRWGEI